MKKVALLGYVIFTLIGLSQKNEIQKVLPDSVVCNQRFAYNVAIDDNTMVVSSRGSKIIGIEDNNLVYVYERAGTNFWQQTQVLHHADFLNYSLRHTVAISDGFIFVSYHGITNRNRNINGVNVYTKNSVGLWEQSQKLKPHGNNEGSYGYTIVAKNKQLIISASAKNRNQKLKQTTKHADVFELENGKWVWNSEVLSKGIAQYNNLGTIVEIEEDKAFISGYYSNPNDEPIWFSTITVKDEKGKIIGQKSSPCQITIPKVYVFSRQGGEWISTQILDSWDEKGWGFGNAFAAFGDYLAVAAFRASIDKTKNLGGAVYIFKKDLGGNYQPFQRVMANDLHKVQLFGTAISLTDQYLIVGAKQDRLNTKGYFKRDRTGACFVFQKDTNGRFVQTQKLVSDKRQKMGYFGRDVAISGNQLVIGSGYQSVAPRYRGDYHDEGAAFTADLTPIVADKIEIENSLMPLPIAKFDTIINSAVQGTDFEVHVFPNPTKGNFTLKRKGALDSKVSVYTTNGKEIYSGDYKGLEQHFSIAGLASGLYYIQIRSSGIVQNLKLVLIE